MPKPKTQEESNQYFNISIEVLFNSIDILEERIEKLEKEKDNGNI